MPSKQKSKSANNDRKTRQIPVSPINGQPVPTNGNKFKPGNPGGPGRPPIKHIRERMLEMMADGTIDQDALIREIRSEDRTLFAAYAFGRPQADVTSGGKPISGVVVIGPKELEDV